MNRILLGCLALMLAGCSSLGGQQSDQQNASADKVLFEGKPLNKDLSFYVRGLMQDLIQNMRYVNHNTPVAVTSFVLLDGDFQTTNLLGQQIAENLIHEIHKFGIPVVDYKMMRAIKVTEHGDFVMSRDPDELESSMPAHYVFTGTMVPVNGGFMVNARVLGMKSRAVIASAQALMPDALITEVSYQSQNKRRKVGDPESIKIIKH